MDADTVRRISPAMNVRVLMVELGKMPKDSQVVFKVGNVCYPVTDAEELFPDEHLTSAGAPRGALRFVDDDEDPNPSEGDPPGVVILT